MQLVFILPSLFQLLLLAHFPHSHNHPLARTSEKLPLAVGANKLMQLGSCGYSLNSRNQQHGECSAKKTIQFDKIYFCVANHAKVKHNLKAIEIIQRNCETLIARIFIFESECKLSSLCGGRFYGYGARMHSILASTGEYFWLTIYANFSFGANRFGVMIVSGESIVRSVEMRFQCSVAKNE